LLHRLASIQTTLIYLSWSANASIRWVWVKDAKPNLHNLLSENEHQLIVTQDHKHRHLHYVIYNKFCPNFLFQTNEKLAHPFRLITDHWGNAYPRLVTASLYLIAKPERNICSWLNSINADPACRVLWFVLIKGVHF